MNVNSETISIPLLNAGVIPDLTVNVVLSSPGIAAALGSPTTNTLTIHRPAPASPTPPVLVGSDDSGLKSDGITDVTNPSLTGTAEAGATVKLLNSAGTAIAQATADSDGKYVIPAPGAPLAPGTYKFSTTATNPYGTSTASGAVVILIVAPPAAPAAPTLLPSQSDGAPGGETTISTFPNLVGATIPGATAQLINSGGGIASQSSVDSSGNYVLAVPGPLSVGSYTFQVRVVDQYGDVSAASPAQTINVAPPFVTLEHVIDVVKKKKVTQLMVDLQWCRQSERSRLAGHLPAGDPGQKGIVHRQERRRDQAQVGDLRHGHKYGDTRPQEAVRAVKARPAPDQRSRPVGPAGRRGPVDRWQPRRASRRQCHRDHLAPRCGFIGSRPGSHKRPRPGACRTCRRATAERNTSHGQTSGGKSRLSNRIGMRLNCR